MENIDYDTRAALLSSALKRAREEEATPLPTGGGDRFDMGPAPGMIFNSLIRQALGGYSAGQREQELTALNDEQVAKFNDIAKQLTTPGTKVLKRTLNALPTDQEGPTGPEVEEQVPLDYSNPADLAADNARRMGLATQMSNLSLPQAQKVAQDYLSKGAAFPDTLAQLQMKQIEAGEQNARRLEEKEKFDRLYKMTAGQQYEIGKAGAANKGITFVPTVDAQGKPVTRVVDKAQLTPGQEFAKPDAKPSAAAEKGINAAATLADKAEQALALLKANPDAVGFKSYLPNTILQRMYPEGVGPRIAISELSAEKSHELYGAAFTAPEMARAGKFLPQDGDDYETSIKKLEYIKQLALSAKERWAKGAPAPAPVPPGGGGNGNPIPTPADIADLRRNPALLDDFVAMFGDKALPPDLKPR